MERGGGGGSLELAGGGGNNSDICLQDLVTNSTGLQHYQHAAAAASMAGLHNEHLQNTMHHHDVHGNSHHDTSMLHNSTHQLSHEPLEKLKRKSLDITNISFFLLRFGERVDFLFLLNFE